MADLKNITPQIDRLDVQLDRLEDALEPLLGNLEGIASELPLLDKAKLFALTAYSIESLLFSTLKLQGADAQNHEVLAELKRVQQYFVKIKHIEDAANEPEQQRSTTVNQEAAARILKADLADNKDISNKLAEKIAEERAKALLKSVENQSRKRPAEDSPAPSPAGEDSSQSQKKPKRKSRHDRKRNN